MVMVSLYSNRNPKIDIYMTCEKRKGPWRIDEEQEKERTVCVCVGVHKPAPPPGVAITISVLLPISFHIKMATGSHFSKSRGGKE